MQTKVSLMSLIILLFPLTGRAQTGLYTYDEGYFIHNNNNWTEYRPHYRNGAWAIYHQLGEEEHFYHLANEYDTITIPRDLALNFFIKQDGVWSVLYQPRQIFSYYIDTSHQIYCHSQGYFTRCGSHWFEYQAAGEAKLWAEYTQTSDDADYFTIQNSSCKVNVPKRKNLDFLIFQDGQWMTLYATTDIFDTRSNYEFYFRYHSYKTIDSTGSILEKPENASISFSRLGHGFITYGGQQHPFRYSKITSFSIENEDGIETGVKIIISDDQYISLYPDWAAINIEPDLPLMDFTNLLHSPLSELLKALATDSTFIRK